MVYTFLLSGDIYSINLQCLTSVLPGDTSDSLNSSSCEFAGRFAEPNFQL